MTDNKLALSEVMILGQSLAESKYFSDVKEASQAVVKILAGQELGIGPVASMSGLYIVKGRVELMANIMASLIKSSTKYDYSIRDHSNQVCLIEFFENGQSVGVSEFSIEDAKLAKLTGGDNWKSYPKNMLFARALSNGAKWFCPDLFNGQSVYTPYETRKEPDPTLESGIVFEGSDVERQRVIRQFIDHSGFPSEGTPIDQMQFINTKFDENESLEHYEPVLVPEILQLMG